MDAYQKIIKIIHDAAYNGLSLEPENTGKWIDELTDLIGIYTKENADHFYELGLKHGYTGKTTSKAYFTYDFDKHLSSFWDDGPAQFMNSLQLAEAIREWIVTKYVIFEKEGFNENKSRV